MFSCCHTVLSLSALVPMTFQVPRFFLHLWSPIRVFACLVVVHIGEKVKRWGQGETPLFDISIETSVHSYFPVQYRKNSEVDAFCFFFYLCPESSATVTGFCLICKWELQNGICWGLLLRLAQFIKIHFLPHLEYFMWIRNLKQIFQKKSCTKP